MKRTFLILTISLTVLTSFGQTWQNVGNGLDITVYDLIKFDSKLYACGRNGVRYWDGNSWTSLPLVHGSSFILTMAVFEDTLFVGGDILWSGSISHVYKYDGITWVQVDGDFNSAQRPSTQRLLTFNGQLISGGRFSSINGVNIRNIAAWNGSSWEGLGNGLNGVVLRLAEHNGELYASGLFTASGADTTVRYIGKWNGTNWTTIDTAHTFTSAGPMISFNGDLIIGNVWDNFSGVPMNGIAKWTGSNFVSMGNNLIKSVSSFWVFDDELYLSGRLHSLHPYDDDDIVLKWNGIFWQQIGQVFNQSVLTIEDYNGEVFCAGFFTAIGNTPIQRIAKFNPSTVGVSELESQLNFNFYPNPTSENIVLNTEDKGVMIISNQLGQIIKTISINTSPILIETSDMYSGIYFLNFQTEKGQSTRKLIKQ